MELAGIIVFSIFIFLGFGYFLFDLLKIKVNNIFVTAWMGILFLGLLSTLVNFFFPLNGVIVYILLSLSLLGCRRFGFACKVWNRQLSKTKIIQVTSWLTFFIFMLLFVTSSSLGGYDTDLYHFQIIRWTHEYATVPGLGNLHTRLANTSYWYVISALYPSQYLVYVPTIMTSIFSILAIGWGFSALNSSKTKWEIAYIGTTLFFCMYSYYKLDIHLYADPVALFLLMIAIYYFMCTFYLKSDLSHNYLMLGVLFVTLSFTVKSLTVILPISSLFFAYFAWKKKLVSIRYIFIIFSLPSIAAIAWMAKNFILSGYLFFPVSIFPLDVEWVMPLTAIDSNRIAVQGWARWPGAGYVEAFERGISYWFPSWLDRHTSSRSIQTIFVPIFLGILLALYVLKKRKDIVTWFFYISIVGSIFYWFSMFPDPRFGINLFWIFLAISLAYICIEHEKHPRLSYSFIKPRYFTVIMLVLFVFMFFGKTLYRNSANISFTAQTWPALPAQEIILEADKREPKMFLWAADFGNDRCGYEAFPCVPSKNDVKNILRINPYKIQEGFKVLR